MSLGRSPEARRRAREKRAAKIAEPGRAEWKTEPPSGPCECCGRRGRRMRHHVVREQDVRRFRGDPWDQENAMLLGRWCACHGDHHAPNGQRRIALAKVPDRAIAFAVDLLGGIDLAGDYFRRHYSAVDDDRRVQ